MKLLQEMLAIVEAGRTFTIKNPDIKPRGAPEEKARAFDKVNPKTGARPNHSVLKTIGKSYSVSDSSNEGDYIQVLVWGGDVPEIDIGRKYHGVNVLFMADGSIKASTADKIADRQWKDDKDKIIAVARKAVGADRIAAFVKRGGDTEHRKPDDWDNGYNDSYSGPKMHKRADR